PHSPRFRVRSPLCHGGVQAGGVSANPACSAHVRLAAAPFLNGAILALPRMGEILAEQADEHRGAGAGFARRYHVGEEMPVVVAFDLVAAGRDDRGTV